jgi:hypothetical protein
LKLLNLRRLTLESIDPNGPLVEPQLKWGVLSVRRIIELEQSFGHL